MTHKSHLFLWLCILLSGFIYPHITYAQQSNRITIEARVGFDNVYTTDTWTPVTLTVRGDDQDRTVTVEWLVNDDLGNRILWSRDISLPAQTTKEIHTNVVMPGFARSIVARVQVDNRILASTLIDAQISPGWLNVVVSDDANLLKGLGDVTLVDGSIITVVVVPPTHLPDDALGYQGVYNLFIDNAAQLTDAQQRAIQLWMELGGRVVVPDVVSGTLATNSQISLDYSTPHVVRLTTEVTAQLPDDVVVPTVKPSPLAVEVHPGSNLLWERSVGRGTFYQTTVPFNALRDWSGLAWLWRPVLQPQYPDIRAVVGRPNIVIQNDPLGRSLNIAALSQPHPVVIFLLILAYIAIIGPGTYVVLKRRYTLDWAWVSIPATAIIITILLAITGVILRGNNTLVYTLSIVQQQAQATHALVSSGTAIYTPFRSSYVVDANDADSIIAVRNSQVADGLRFGDDKNAQIALSGDIGSVQSVHTHHMIDAPLSVTHQLTADASTLTGRIQIAGGNLRDVVVFYGSKGQFVGDVAQNQPITVSIDDTIAEFPCDVNSDLEQPFDQRRLYEVVAGYCGAVTALPTNRVIVYGWSDAPTNPPVVQATRVTAQRQLHVITINLP